MRYVIERIIHEQESKAYRIYMSDIGMALVNNTANFAGGSTIKVRYVNLIDKKKKDRRTGKEIAADVIKKAGLVVVRK